MASGLPHSMTAIEITAPGGPDVLKPTTRPVPQPGPGEVLIRVKAAGINRPDVLQRAGRLSAAARRLRPAGPGSGGRDRGGRLRGVSGWQRRRPGLRP